MRKSLYRLLIDEILAVGDAGFQAKCFNRLKEIKANGTTIVIVSHSMGQIEQICNRSIWIHEGKIKAAGRPRDIDPQYLDYMGEQRQAIAEKEEERKKKLKEQKTEQAEKKEEAQELKENLPKPQSPKDEKMRWGNGDARITAIHLLSKEGRECVSFRTNGTMFIKIDYNVKKCVEDAVFGIGIYRIDEVHCYGTNTRIDNIDEFQLRQDGSVTLELSPMALLPGKYLLDIAIESGMGIPVDFYKRAKEFEVFSKVSDVGIARLAHTWDMEGV